MEKARGFALHPLFGHNTRIQTSAKSQVNDDEVSSSNQNIAVLICPAQFCVPADYENLIDSLQAKNPSIVSAKVAPLPR